MATVDSAAIATAAITKAREQSMKCILEEIPEEHRGRFTTICVNSIPDEVSFVDGMVLILMLIQMGRFRLDDSTIDRIDFNLEKVEDVYDSDDDYESNWKYEIDLYDVHPKIDEDGRIIAFSIGRYFEQHRQIPYDLPSCIVHLDRLEYLFVIDCRSLPAEALPKLPNLRTLELYFRDPSDLLNNFPLQMELNQLKTLEICGGKFQPPAHFLEWMTTNLPNLENLGFWHTEKKETERIIKALSTHDVCFAQTFKRLDIRACNLDDKLFESLLLDALPKFQSLSTLNVVSNKIESLQNIAKRIENDNKKPCVVAKSLRHIYLTGNFVENKLKNNPKEKHAMLSLLKVFNAVCTLKIYGEEHFDSDVDYALRINDAGRSLVEGGNDELLPLSVWPTVLERAYAESHRAGLYLFRGIDSQEKNPTGLYYLLRNGPALVSRSNLLGGSRYNDDGQDDENEKKDPKSRPNNNKRKRTA